MLGVKIEKDGDVFKVEGSLDETADFAALEQAAEPILLNMRGIKGINSLGLRKFVKVVQTFEAKQVEFHECSTSFIDSVNMVSLLVGGDGHMTRIKSVVVPYKCPDGHLKDVLLKTDALAPKDGVVTTPVIGCPRCSVPMHLDVEPEEHFAFLLDSF